MALDSVPANGRQIASDRDGAQRHHQILKLAIGPEGTFVLVDDSNPVPIKVIGSLNATFEGTSIDVDDFPASAASTDAVGAVVDAVRVQDGLESLPTKFARINVAANGDNTVVAAVVGKAIRVLAMTLSVSAAMDVSIKSGGSTIIAGPFPLAVTGGFAPAFAQGICETAENEALVLNLSSANQVGGMLTYIERDVA